MDHREGNTGAMADDELEVVAGGQTARGNGVDGVRHLNIGERGGGASAKTPGGSNGKVDLKQIKSKGIARGTS